MKTWQVLVADDDREDCEMMREAFLECSHQVDIQFVSNGEELVSFVSGHGFFKISTNKPQSSIPDLILLDLNMPRKDGREVLRELKSNLLLKHIPIVVFTTSSSDEDVRNAYQLGADSYVVKPVTFAELVKILEKTMHYWFDIAGAARGSYEHRQNL